ncbi:hypothetical protein GCM10009789_28220 [Kribbella sancticallisti]|uniref:NmrA-like domain-containing protein n=1 Tax=Kribbella sancticallisti TaxID=460087 RepID=A0ABN2D9L4_9ACTN
MEAVYLVAPDDPAPIAGFVEQAVAAGVRRFVVLSGRGMEHADGRFGAGMAEAERAVQAAGVTWTIIQAANFDQNFDEDLWHAPLLAGRLALPAAGVVERFVDLEDVAEVAAVLLTEPGHEGRIHEVAGPDVLTFGDAVEAIAAASGRSISYVDVSPAEYEADLVAEGWPPEVAAELSAMFDVLRDADLGKPADGVEQVLGRTATPFADYVARVWRAG